jgi:anti-anti-sigma factor
MAIEFEDVSEDFRLIKLSGRLDVKGTYEIETQFTALSAARSKKVLVDLREVNFLASIAIRAIITNAKALQMKGGHMALLAAPETSVSETLETTGIDELVPLFTDEDKARDGLAG